LAGIELLETLNENDVTTARPIVVASFTNEEGARFQPDMMGSLVYARGLSLEEALASSSREGTTLREELARIGYAGSAKCGEIVPHAYVELHIEQGPILDRKGESLGVVKDLQGISWQEVKIQGTSNHAGTTPMDLRHDAGYCAARVTTFVREMVLRMGGSQVGTVGSIQLKPNLVNVIASEAVLTVDLRNTDDERLARAERELKEFLDKLAAQEGVTISTKSLARTQSVQFDQRVVKVISSVVRDMGQHARVMTSGAGHDAQMMARICPTAMIFVPSIGGISHNPREDTSKEHLELGANVLLGTVLALACE
jgi:N-carbamoyl-L-amino-acid hydrolase